MQNEVYCYHKPNNNIDYNGGYFYQTCIISAVIHILIYITHQQLFGINRIIIFDLLYGKKATKHAFNLYAYPFHLQQNAKNY